MVLLATSIATQSQKSQSFLRALKPIFRRLFSYTRNKSLASDGPLGFLAPRMRFCLNARRRRLRQLFVDHQKLRDVAVKLRFLRKVLFLLWRHFAKLLTTRYTARSELFASDLVLREPLLLRIILPGMSHLPNL